MLSGWLFRTVRFAAMDAMKIDNRRRRREQDASLNPEEEADPWHQLAPCLDEGLASLAEKDRLAILLRFFDKKAWDEVGTALGLNENAARARVTRALEKLRLWFFRRGISVSAVALSSLLLANAVTAAPASLGASSAAKMLAEAIARKWLLKKISVAALAGIVLLVLFGGGGVWMNRRIETRRAVQRAADFRAVDAAVVAIDLMLTTNNPSGFIALVHFRAPDEQYRAVLFNYARAFGEFRQEVRARFPGNQARYEAFRIMIRELLRHQPTPARTYVEGDRAGSDRYRRCTIEFVRVDGAWKWDYFGHLTPEQREERMMVLQRKTEVLDRLTRLLRAGEMSDSGELLKAFEEQ